MRALLLLVLLGAVPGLLRGEEPADPPAAATYKLVASPGLALEGVSGEELRKVFLGLKHEVAGVAVTPVLLDGGDAHRDFLREVVAKSETGFRLYWRKQVFSGAGRQPASFADPARAAAHLRGLTNGIAYLPAALATPGLKTLELE